jgi:hypothetical protein
MVQHPLSVHNAKTSSSAPHSTTCSSLRRLAEACEIFATADDRRSHSGDVAVPPHIAKVRTGAEHFASTRQNQHAGHRSW